MFKPSRILVALSRSNRNQFCTCENRLTRFRKNSSVNPKEYEKPTGTSRVRSKDPGIGQRLKILSEDQPNIREFEVDEDDIDEMEENFMNAKQMVEKHQREMELKNFGISMKITERKHFKPPKEPNMLTWSEKEQIRNLHTEDRIVWTSEKLSESFPATSSIIEKILKSTWVPRNADKARKHDEAVAKNWQLWNSGELKIHSEELREHLKKFNRKNILPHSKSDYSQFADRSLPEPRTSEFSSIIESYKLLKLESDQVALKDESSSTQKRIESGQFEDNIPDFMSRKLDKRIHSKVQTLDLLREDVAKSMVRKRDLNEMDRQFVKKYVDEINSKKIESGHTDMNMKRWEDNKNEDQTLLNEENTGKDVEKYENSSRKVNSINITSNKNYDNSTHNISRGMEREIDIVNVGIPDSKESSGILEHSFSDHDVGTPGSREPSGILEHSFSDHGVGTPGPREPSGILEHSFSDHDVGTPGPREPSRILEHSFSDHDVGTPGSREPSRILEHSFSDHDVGTHGHREPSRILEHSFSDHGVGTPGPRELSDNNNTSLSCSDFDSEVIDLGKRPADGYKPKYFESEFDANCRYPPARYNKQDTIIWRPQKKATASVDHIPNRIRIPRDKVKKGYLYKVQDCFYTHEGYFLYRVPGMV